MLMSSSYAPAYQRYGSQINAIHFIGPNKPWNAIPFRSPKSLAEDRVTSSGSNSGTAYDYGSLVDRWFDVYDKHYRSQPPVTSSFQLKHYPSVWDSLHSANPSDLFSSGSHFTLDDLRKMAIEGMSGAGFDNPSSTGQAGEGEYRSLPLEGRFDLMRPRKPPSIESDDDSLSMSRPSLSPDVKMEMDYSISEIDLPMTPVPRYLGLPEDPDPVIWHTLPMSGPPKKSGRPFSTTPTAISNYYASSAGPTSDSEGWDSTVATSFPSHLFQQTSVSQPPPQSVSQEQHFHSLDHGQNHSHHNNHGYCERRSSQHNPATRDAGYHHQPHIQPLHSLSVHQAPGRGLSWNPAVEPPPRIFPPHSRIPADTSFTNVWDLQHQEHTRKGIASGSSQASYTPIPEPSFRQGHNRNVTGRTSSDHNRVRSIFPWEDQPRQPPSRVFLDPDPPFPLRFVGQTKPTTPATATAKLLDENGSEKGPDRCLPPRMPTTLSFTNAWDGDRRIQNYASRLVRSYGPHANFDDRRENAWGEKVEANSQDGDDEDEGDEDEIVGDIDSDDDTRRRPRMQTISVVQDTKEVQRSVRKAYRSLGTQTVPREKRSQGVQMSTLVEGPSNQAASRRSSISGKRTVVVGSGPSAFQGRDAGRSPEYLLKHGTPSIPSAIWSRSVSSGAYGKSFLSSEHGSRPQRDLIVPSLSHSPRPSAKSSPPHVSEPPTVPSPPRGSTPRLMNAPGKIVPSHKRPRSWIQTSRNGPHSAKTPSTSEGYVFNDLVVGSPPSWIGPMSPPEDRPSSTLSPAVRKGTRAWDPARGVELFKQESEEVLARFLQMDSWDENTRRES